MTTLSNEILLAPGWSVPAVREGEFKVCAQTVMDTSDPLITFDEKGVCHYVQYFNEVIRPNWFPNEQGQQRLEQIVEQIKRETRGKEYNCIIGLSGGVDSSYLAFLASQYGLRILAVHVDGGWNSELAVKNIQNIVTHCGIDLYTHVVDWEDMRELQLSFFKSGLANQDIPQDHAFFAALYHFAIRHQIRWVLHGGNAATEAILPEAWGYNAMDGRHLRDVHRKHSKHPLKSYPIINFFQHVIYYPYIRKMKQARLLNLVPYDKREAIRILEREVGFRYYGGKHHESRFTRFFQAHILPLRYGYDKRKAHLSSMIVSGLMSREEAIEELKQPLYPSMRDLEMDKTYFIKKLRIDEEQYQRYINQPTKSYTEYENNEALLKRMAAAKKKFKTVLSR
ncbi:MAG: N-acetyl sugar amidotransferase [Saprospiraceae bacterium]|nr:N-acetyl sugar amidotransferase [Saprospiraceae bacterium]